MSFSVASYNVLATAYIKPAWYPRTPAALLDPQWRIPALVRHVVALETDVVCLQEIENDTFAALRTRLCPMGYVAHYAPKTGGKPDGCATFVQTDTLALRTTRVIAYADGHGTGGDSGHIALVLILHHVGRTLGIANTHLRWDPPGTPREEQRGYRQIRQLLDERDGVASDCQGWIIAGDLNVTPATEVVAALEQAGLEDAHRTCAHMYTCNSNNKAKRIDYLFHTPSLRAEPGAMLTIDDQTPLPSMDQPSDHLAIASRFHWISGKPRS